MNWLLMLKSTAVLALLATATIGVGAPLARWLAVRSTDRISRLVWEASLGMAAVATLLGWLGLGGVLDQRAIMGGTLVASLLGCLRLRRLCSTDDDATPVSASELSSPPQWLSSLLLLATGAAAASSFLSALVPPTAGDALVYHLELPKRFLQHGELIYRADDDNCVYPLVAEMGFLWALAFDDVAATSLVHWGYGVLLAGAAYLLAVRLLGTSWARIAACLVLLTPGVSNQMTAPLNDVALALYAALATAAWLTARNDGTWRDFTLVGLMLGAAISVKYTGLLFAAAMAVVWLVTAIEDVGRRRQLLSGAVVTSIAVIAVAGLWYGRAAWHRGDPIYPFLSDHSVAHASANLATSSKPSVFPESKAPLGRGPAAVLAAPWMMTMEPERFGGRGHQLGPLFLMFVPCLIACRNSAPLARSLWIAGLYGGGCLLLRQNLRFLLPMVPILATAVVASWREMLAWPRAPRWIVAAATFAVLLFLTAIPLARLRHTASALIGRETFDAYLDRTEPSHAVAQWINAHLSPDSHILSQEQRTFYLAPNVTRESLYRRRTAYDFGLHNGAELGPRLRSDGFSHLFTAECEGSPGVGYDVTLSRLVAAAVAADASTAPQFVHEWRHVDAQGTARHYRLWELRSGVVADGRLDRLSSLSDFERE